MPYLAAAVVLVGLIGVLNLVLTIGVIRRLREHTERLSARPEPGGSMPAIIAPPGATIGEFAATTVDGAPFTSGSLTPSTVVAFFSPRCPACEERMPQFLEYAGQVPGGRERVFVVILGAGDDIIPLRERLAPVAQVILEAERDGPLAAVFKVTGTPSFCLMGTGRAVAASDFDLDTLPIPQAA